MNLALLDPFSHNELPEVIEAKLEIQADVKVCAFNRRGNLLAGGCENGHVIVWDFETHGVARTLELHDRPVSSVSWTKSSRRLLSSGFDGRLVVWDVLRSAVLRQITLDGVELSWASTHPLKRDLCLVCCSSTSATHREVFLQHWKPLELCKLLYSPDAHEPPAAEPDAPSCVAGGGGAGGGGSRRQPPPLVACFDRPGERVIIANSKGLLTLMGLDGTALATLQVAGAAAVKSIAMSRDGKSFALNSADRVVRAFTVQRLLEGGTAAGREMQDVVNRVQWAHAAFTSDSEHVIGAASTAEQKMYIWDGVGHLTKMLDGPKDGIAFFASHPTRPILAVCARSGDIYVWTKQYCENWSAFAPDFKELEENEEYEEREDEFDLHSHQVEARAEEAEEMIDILTVEPSEHAHVPDSDDPDPELVCLPTRPEPEDAAAAATPLAAAAAAAADAADTDADRKARKRKAEGGTRARID